MIDGTRLVAAIAVVLVYVAMSAWFLRPIWRRKTQIAAGVAGDATLIAFASQTGFAEQLAAQTANSLRTVGMPVQLASTRQVSVDTLASVQQALFIVSTTGEGDAPDPAESFVRKVLNDAVALPDLRYGVLALGDRKYANFCAFGHRLDTWLRHQGATALFDVVEVDNGDEGALRNWQHQLSVISASPDLPDWETPRYDRWRITERQLVNPGSAGDPCFHIVLTPGTGANAVWQAGDIAEIDPRNSTWNSSVQPLPHREYSIASIAAEGAIHLLVREMRRPDGEPGIGSGWLTREAAIDSDVALRIRANSNFHLPEDARPLILVGNGTGIAGLRALIKARSAAGHYDNWLFFGERNESKDYFFREDIQNWHRQKHITELDMAFSRDQAERRYVQHRLMDRGNDIRAWISAGAAIYVCGSLKGMAPGVDTALTHILGADTLEQLAAAGRYRRDVY
jgi:sulfite reductase (NADPH) flavoprotein alpha-component